MVSAFRFPGSVSLTTTTLTNVADINSSYLPDANIGAYSSTIARQKANLAITIKYYIQADYNLNSLIGYQASASDATDDQWSFSATGDLVIAKATASNVSYNLPIIPAGTKVLIKKVGVETKSGFVPLTYSFINNSDQESSPVTVTAVEPISALSEAFLLYATLTSNTSGVITATAAFENNPTYNSGSFKSLKISVAENILEAQIVSFGYNSPIQHTVATQTDADTLTATIDAAFINAQAGDQTGDIATKLGQIAGVYNNQNVLSTWSFTFTAQPLTSQDNAISKHARNVPWTPGGTYFTAGQKIVTSTAKNLTLNVTDVTGATVTLIGSTDAAGDATDVYGVLQQTA
jgi:hypothetical protein